MTRKSLISLALLSWLLRLDSEPLAPRAGEAARFPERQAEVPNDRMK
jgi:hypothetical protein